MIEFIASKFDQNVRELEGALVRVVAWSELTRQPIDIDAGRAGAAGPDPQTEHEIPPPLIMEETADYFSLSTGDLVSKSPLAAAHPGPAHRDVPDARVHRPVAGEDRRDLRRRDHTTALHGIKKVEDEMRARDATFRQVQDLTRIIRGRVAGGVVSDRGDNRGGRRWRTS